MKVSAKVTVKTVTHKGQDGLSWPALEAEFKRIRKSSVRAGVLGKGKTRPGAVTNAQLAAIHEYGLGNAWARPWIGPPLRANRAKYFALVSAAYKKALKSGKPTDVEKALALIGMQMVTDIKNGVTQGAGIPPPNQPKTIARKGSSRTLVDTSGMVNSVTYEVIKGV